jgi:hypothetical protein
MFELQWIRREVESSAVAVGGRHPGSLQIALCGTLAPCHALSIDHMGYTGICDIPNIQSTKKHEALA